MGRSYVKKRIRKLKELADKESDETSKEMLLIFYDVFKFLVERASPQGYENPEEESENEKE